MYLLAYSDFFQGNLGKYASAWSARFLFDRQKVVIADHHDRERWERYFEPCCTNSKRTYTALISKQSHKRNKKKVLIDQCQQTV
jgi:hypothetical protein